MKRASAAARVPAVLGTLLSVAIGACVASPSPKVLATGDPGLIGLIVGLRSPTGLFANFHRAVTAPTLLATHYDRAVLGELAPAAADPIAAADIRGLLEAADPDTYLESAAAARAILGGDLPADWGVLDRVLPLQQVDGHFEDAVVGQLTGIDRDEVRVTDTVAALTLLDDISSSDARARGASARAFDWLGRRWADLAYSPYLAWLVYDALVKGGAAPAADAVRNLAAGAVAADAPGDLDDLRRLLDAFGTASLAQGTLGSSWSEANRTTFRDAFGRKATVAIDPLDTWAAIGGYLASGGDRTDPVVRATVDRIVAMQSKGGLFGDPVSGTPSLQATWYALASLQVLGGSAPDPSTIAALNAAFANLSPDTPADLRAWLEATRLVGESPSPAERDGLKALLEKALPSQVDETTVFNWYQVSMTMEASDIHVPAPQIVPWAPDDQAGLLATAVLAQPASGRAAIDLEGLKTRVRRSLGTGLTMPELYFFVRLLGASSLSTGERGDAHRDLAALQLPDGTFTGQRGGDSDLRATYFGLWLSNELGSSQ